MRRHTVNRTAPQRAQSGCSGLGAFLLFLLVVSAVIGWPIYLESHGAAAPGVITEKRETVRINRGEWFRRFEVIAAYSIPGQRLERHAVCDVNEKTYDSLHLGHTVGVHYFASLLDQPFLPATRLSPCSTLASFNSSSPVVWHLVTAFVVLLAILFLWRVLRIRIAVWLLLPWLCWSFAYLVLPRIEPEPQSPIAATAIVDSIATITTLGDMSGKRSIALQHPYQLVRLKFLPSGMDTAVVAIDKVDVGSVPNLKEGQMVNIAYDAAHPRVARMQQGTRFFPGRARLTILLLCSVFLVLLVILWAAGVFFRLIRRSVRI